MYKPLCAGFTLFSIALLSSAAGQAEQILTTGKATIVDGSTLIINGQPVELYGIQVPELGTFCDQERRKYDCGIMARSSLMDMTAGVEIACHKAPSHLNGEKYKCLSDGYDLSQGMVYTGWAKPLKSAPAALNKLLVQAKEKRHGMWRLSKK